MLTIFWLLSLASFLDCPSLFTLSTRLILSVPVLRRMTKLPSPQLWAPQLVGRISTTILTEAQAYGISGPPCPVDQQGPILLVRGSE